MLPNEILTQDELGLCKLGVIFSPVAGYFNKAYTNMYFTEKMHQLYENH